MRRSTPLQDILSTPVTASHMTQDTDLHVTLRYRQGVGLMGGERDRKRESLVYLVQVVGLFLWVILSHSTLLTQQVAYLLCCCRDIMSVQSYQRSKTIYSHRHVTYITLFLNTKNTCVCVCVVENTDAWILGARSPRQPHFVWWHLIFVGSQNGTCFMSPFWHLGFWKCMDSWFRECFWWQDNKQGIVVSTFTRSVPMWFFLLVGLIMIFALKTIRKWYSGCSVFSFTSRTLICNEHCVCKIWCVSLSQK